MTDVGRHPNIELMTLSEVESIKGYVGNFQVTVRKKARYIDEKECTACGDCVEVCPVLKPDEFDLGLRSRKAVYIPFPQAVPSAYVLNPLDCLGQDPLICGKCKEACEKACIDYDMLDEELTFRVGTIVVATGMEPYDPTPLDEYGYTRFRNIVTTLEFERLINAGGPTKGEVLRLSDLKVPKSVAFIQCVGSRSPGNPKANPYCSNICCMNTIKDTLMLKEHYPHVEVKVFYMDIRAFGKGFEDLYHRSKGKGVRYIRGLPGDVQEDPESNDLILFVENTSMDRLERHHVEMVVLSQGLVPSKDMGKIQEMLSLQKTPDGFYLEAHPKLQPVDSASKGIFFAGTAEGPKDIKDAVTQASAAAARAARVMSPGKIRVEGITSRVDSNKCTSCGICAKVCPYNAIIFDKKSKQPAVVIEAACAGCGTCAAECPFDAIEMNHFSDAQILSQVHAIVEKDPQEKVICFACNWCSYAGADFAGVSRLKYPTSVRLIRTMCSGRVDEKFIWEAYKSGAPAVLVSGCHFGDCHYIDANHWTQKRVEKIWKKMEKWGLRKERLQLEWISAAEGIRFSRVMAKMEELRQGVTKQEIAATKKILKQKLKKVGKLAPRGENQKGLGKESEGKVV
jgi:heterodisulfide reductase subunit A